MNLHAVRRVDTAAGMQCRPRQVCWLWQDAYVRKAFAHNATLRIPPSGDDGAPGAAITNSLCGHWEHEQPCRMAPHHTRADRTGDEVRLRTLFAVEPELEPIVRQRIEAALASLQFVAPDGVLTTWQLLSSNPGDVHKTELQHAARLIRN